MRRLLHAVTIAFVTIGVVALAQSPKRSASAPEPAAPASESTEHDFDFLLGSWEFTAESKLPETPPKYPGRWTAERTGAGALVEDDFIVTDDQGVRRYLGVTVRAFDAKTKRWTTAFVVPPGASWSIGTAWREGREIHERPLDTDKGRRAQFLDIGTDHFTWSMDRSTDGGKTWVTMVRVEARRASGGQRP